jgi:hypothetical protein
MQVTLHCCFRATHVAIFPRGNSGFHEEIAVTVSRHVSLSRHVAGNGYENKNARATSDAIKQEYE